MSIHHKITIGAVLALGMALWSGAVLAQEQCGPREAMARQLKGRFGEVPRALGLINGKAVLEFFRSPSDTWTMVVTNNAGMSCVLVAGEVWDELPPADFKAGKSI